MKFSGVLFFVVFVLVPSAIFGQQDKGIVILNNEEELTQLRMERHLNHARMERQSRMLVSFLDRLNEKDGLIGTLELVAEQKIEIKAIQEQYLKAKESLGVPVDSKEEAEFGRRLSALKAKYASKIRECLLEEQVDSIFSSQILGKGIPKVLLESQIGDALRLTDEQKKRIANSSDEISKKIVAFQLEIREEACKAVFKELTPDQRKQFQKIYDLKTMTSYFHQRSIERLGQDYYFKKYSEMPEFFQPGSVFPEFSSK